MATDKTTRNNLWQYYQSIDMPGGYSHNLPETLRMIDLYYNSKFKTGQYDSQGMRKFFYNIVKPTCDIATKFIDLDTKDIILLPQKDQDEFRVWIMQRRLKQWLEDNKFGELLNDISFSLPKYGKIVTKKVKKKIQLVNIQNIRVDAAAKSLKDSPFVYELITMSRGDIEDMPWNKDAIKEFLAEHEDEETFLLYDCYDRKGKKWEHSVKADLFCYTAKNSIQRSSESQINTEANYLPANVLFSDTVDNLPYDELSWENVPGRWLGYGFVEYLEDNQIAINEAENLERKGLAFKALQLFQTRDDSVGGQNVLTNAQNGDILRVDSEITPIQKDDSDLSAYNNTRANWNQNIERKTFSTDITTGASLPSRTPLGVANLQATFASSYFELKRENVGFLVRNLLIERIIPDFENDTAKEHELTFLGSDSELDKLDKSISEILVGDACGKYAERTGFFPSHEQREEAKNRVMGGLRKRQNRYLKVPKDFYVNAKYVVRVLITGENVDNGARSQVIQMAMQIVGTNPAVTKDPISKALFFQLLALGGISPVDIGALNEADQVPPPGQVSNMMQGMEPKVAGSMAAPMGGQGMSSFASTKQL